MLDFPSKVLPDVADVWVVFDIEASGLHPDDGAWLSTVGVAFYEGANIRSYAFPFDHGQLDKTDLPRRFQGDGLFDTTENLPDKEWLFLCEWLSRQRLIAHNAKYDMKMMVHGLRSWQGAPSDSLFSGVDLGRRLQWDTQVVAALIWPGEQTGLKVLAARFWGEDERDAERRLKAWFAKHCDRDPRGRIIPRYDLAPWSLVGPYCAKDCALTLRLFDTEMAHVATGELPRPLVEREIDLVTCLHNMELRGLGYDVEMARREDAKLTMMIAQAEGDLRQATGRPGITEQAMRNYWFGPPDSGGLGLKPKQTTDKGQAQVTIEVVRDLVQRGVPGAAEYQAMSKLQTAQSMWYGSWWRLCGSDGRLRTSYWQTKATDDTGKARGTISGRMAVERVQLHAIPHDYQIPEGLAPVRSLFQAKAGYEVWECDLCQAEMRVAAAVSDCKELKAGFARGDDAHTLTTILVFNTDDANPEWGFLRNVSKRLNFGMVYGAGVRTIQAQIKIYTGRHVALEQVESWLDAFHAAFPELQREYNRSMRAAERHGYVPLPGGRRRYFTAKERDEYAWRKAFNARIQGGVAEMMKVAMIEVEAMMPGILLNQIHDSLMVEVPKPSNIVVVDSVKAIMTSTFEQEFGLPFKADAKLFADDVSKARKGLVPV